MVTMTRQTLNRQQVVSVGRVMSPRKVSALESSRTDGGNIQGQEGGMHHRRSVGGVRPEAFIGFIRPTDDAALNYDRQRQEASTFGFDRETEQLGSSYVNKDAMVKWNGAENWLVCSQSTTERDVLVEAKKKCGHLHGLGALRPGRQTMSLSASYRERNAYSHVTNDECELHIAANSRNGEGSPLSVGSDGHKHCVKRAMIPHFVLTSEKTKKIDSLKPPSSALLHSPCSAKGNTYFDAYSVANGCVDTQGMCIASERKHPFLKSPSSRIQKPTSDCHVSSPSLAPGNSVRSVSMRDTGTEMTPIASQEPSRTGTPIGAATPNLRSPILTSPSSAREGSPIASAMRARKFSVPALDGGSKVSKLSVKQMQGEPRNNDAHEGVRVAVIAWTNKEEEDMGASMSLKDVDIKEAKKNLMETRATAWEEAQTAKYLARFKREEAKILAWRNHEKAKAEAEQRRIEVMVERKREQAQEKLRKSLEAAKQKAEARRSVVVDQASRATHVLPTGRFHSSFFSCSFCY